MSELTIGYPSTVITRSRFARFLRLTDIAFGASAPLAQRSMAPHLMKASPMKMTSSTIKIAVLATCAWQLVGCMVGPEGDENLSSTGEGPTFEEFRAQTYREPWEGGHYIVDGDRAIADDKSLYEFWEGLQQGGLIINKNGAQDDKWNDTQKLNLTYCVSNAFGTRKQTIIDALKAATDQGWEVRANVNFIYVPGEDANCTRTNNNVVFNVGQVSGQPYLARAFFPANARSSREVLVDTSSFGNVGWPLSHILGHELGHALGFRHEHTRPEAGTCFEDNNWRPLTTYDSASIMHYPQCNGSSQDLDWTTKDAQGAQAVYGAPGATPPPSNPPPSNPPPSSGSTEMKSGSVGSKQNVTIGAYNVKVGSTFTVNMTGTGDPDLYVRWNSAPTTTAYNCRPYIDGPTETCSLTVPTGATTANVMVRGYTAGTYNLTITWTAP